jgi:gamma-glutamyltranspeptidase/glutathione hydrolase
MSTGIGGDFFDRVHRQREETLCLECERHGSHGATLERLTLSADRDPQNWGPGSGMPLFGILPVTVPGAVWGWQEILTRFGTRGFKELLQPAIQYARDGVPITERIASDWLLPDVAAVGQKPSGPDPDSVRAWYVAGKPPAAGTVFRNPELAHTLELLQQQGAAAFYQGDVARAIVAKSTALGGTMTMADLASYRGEWGAPAQTRYHGYDVFELPPPSQDWATLEMLNILQTCVPQWAPGQTLAMLGPRSPLFWHLLVEAKKLAYADLFEHNADPHYAAVPVKRLYRRLCRLSVRARRPQTGLAWGARVARQAKATIVLLKRIAKAIWCRG